jgi:hypothetical protein
VAVPSVIAADVVVGVATGFWFILFGLGKMRAAPSGGRRSVPLSRVGNALRRLRGVLEVLGGLGVLALVAVDFVGDLGSRWPDPSALGLMLGLALAVLSGWTVVEAFLNPRKWVQLILALVGFALAVFYAGFR